MARFQSAENALGAGQKPVGVDGGIALVEFGAERGIDTTTAQAPIVGFVFSHKGLMYNLSFEGSKITKVKR